MRHTPGAYNLGADAPFRINQLSLPPKPNIDLEVMTKAIVMDPDIDKIRRDSSLNKAIVPVTASQNAFLGDVSQSRPGPMAPEAHRYPKFLA